MTLQMSPCTLKRIICSIVKLKMMIRAALCVVLLLVLTVFSTCFALQIIFHQQNPGIDYEFYIPVEKKEGERERLSERERETPREAPRERQRERESGRAPLRSEFITSWPSDFFSLLFCKVFDRCDFCMLHTVAGSTKSHAAHTWILSVAVLNP